MCSETYILCLQVVMSKDSRKTPRDMSVRDEQTGSMSSIAICISSMAGWVCHLQLCVPGCRLAWACMVHKFAHQAMQKAQKSSIE